MPVAPPSLIQNLDPGFTLRTHATGMQLQDDAPNREATL